MKPKSVENYTGMESEGPFGDEMPNFNVCGTVFKELFKDIDVLDDAKQPPRAKMEGGKVQKMSRIRGKEALSSQKTFVLGFPNDARA